MGEVRDGVGMNVEGVVGLAWVRGYVVEVGGGGGKITVFSANGWSEEEGVHCRVL